MSGFVDPLEERRLKIEKEEEIKRRTPQPEAISVRKARADAARDTAEMKEQDGNRKSSFEAKRAQEKAEDASKEDQRKSKEVKAKDKAQEERAARELADWQQRAVSMVSPGGKPTLPLTPGGRYDSPDSSEDARKSPVRKLVFFNKNNVNIFFPSSL